MDEYTNTFKKEWVKELLRRIGKFLDHRYISEHHKILAEREYDKVKNYKEIFCGYKNKNIEIFLDENKDTYTNIVFINEYKKYTEPPYDMIPSSYEPYLLFKDPSDAKEFVENTSKSFFFFETFPEYELVDTLVIYI